MLYPLKFREVYKDYLWGGRNLEQIGKRLPAEGIVAESWEISAHPNGLSVIANGPYAGISLLELYKANPGDMLGESFQTHANGRFPLLIKFIDACDRLSVQVHPDDAQAKRLEPGDSGKNEIWYVIDAKPGSRLIAGIRPGVDRAHFTAGLAEGRLDQCLEEIEVKAGDVINIPAGLIHAIGDGLLICEIQQSSDATYRVYDYNRTDSAGRARDLHIEKALEVISFDRPAVHLVPGYNFFAGVAGHNKSHRRLLALNRFFRVEEWQVNGRIDWQTAPARFAAITVLSGKGSLEWNESGETLFLPVRQGESVLIPAVIPDWCLTGDLCALVSCLPHYTDYTAIVEGLSPSIRLDDTAYAVERSASMSNRSADDPAQEEQTRLRVAVSQLVGRAALEPPADCIRSILNEDPPK